MKKSLNTLSALALGALAAGSCSPDKEPQIPTATLMIQSPHAEAGLCESLRNEVQEEGASVRRSIDGLFRSYLMKDGEYLPPSAIRNSGDFPNSIGQLETRIKRMEDSYRSDRAHQECGISGMALSGSAPEKRSFLLTFMELSDLLRTMDVEEERMPIYGEEGALEELAKIKGRIERLKKPLSEYQDDPNLREYYDLIITLLDLHGYLEYRFDTAGGGYADLEGFDGNAARLEALLQDPNADPDELHKLTAAIESAIMGGPAFGKVDDFDQMEDFKSRYGFHYRPGLIEKLWKKSILSGGVNCMRRSWRLSGSGRVPAATP